MTVHANKTKQKLAVKELLEKPITSEKLTPVFDMKKFGIQFKKQAKDIEGVIRSMDQAKMEDLQKALAAG